MSLRATALCFCLSLGACAGGGAAVSDTNPCPAITGVFDPNAKLVTPASGATGVPTTVASISFTVSIPITTQ